MARRRRLTARSAIVDHDGGRRAELFVDARGAGIDPSVLRAALQRVDRYPAALRAPNGGQTSIIVDATALRLYLGDAEIDETHDGDEFVALAERDGVDLYVVDVDGGVDLRRSPPSGLDDAVSRRAVSGARVPAFAVDVL